MYKFVTTKLLKINHDEQKSNCRSPRPCLSRRSYAQDDTAKKKVKAYMVSDAHLDTQWNWDIQTTINEYVWNTISQNLFLLKKYPEYVFNFEGGVKYAWMKEYYPQTV